MAKRLPKGWKRIELGELVNISSGGTPSRANPDFWGGSTPWITAKDLKTFDLQDSKDRLSDDGAARSAMVPEDTLLVLVRGMGLFKDVPIGITTKPMAFNQDIKALIPKTEIAPRFLGYALKARRHYLMERVDLAGHGTGRLPTSVLEELPLAMPPVDEQVRIVSALDTISRRSALTDRLLGMQRQIYTAFLDRYARAAFQKRPPKGWRTVHLGNVLTERDERSAGLPLLAITARQGLVPRDDLERRDTSAADKSKYKVIRPGDLGYNTMRMWQGVCGLSRHHGIVSPAYTVVEPVEGKMLGEFAAHLFRHPRVIHTFRRYSQGLVNDTLLLKFPHFSEIRLAIPDIDKQTAIAAALDAQMAYVDLIKEQGRALRQQKLGLMQKLLSGEWRLTADLPLPEVAHG